MVKLNLPKFLNSLCHVPLKESSKRPLLFGVPQGSILGPVTKSVTGSIKANKLSLHGKKTNFLFLYVASRLKEIYDTV